MDSLYFYGLLALGGLCAHLYEYPPTNSTLSPIWAPTVRRTPPSPNYFGMGIAELAPLHKKQRLIRRHQLANSKDPRVRQIHNDLSEYQAQRDKRGSLKRGTNEWKEYV